MEYIIKGRRPESFFRFFEDICALPHGSSNEKAVCDYIESFAKERSLEYIRDGIFNIFVRKPASPGCKDMEPALLQAHTDMVCEKNGDVQHDFTRDPLKLRLDGKYLRAEGTTLGGDDGVGVAMMLALLDTDEPLPELECLFTVQEETGLAGALDFDYQSARIKSRRCINLDSESEGVATAGCAGSLDTTLSYPLERYPVPEALKTLKVTIKGLCGGHSGGDITTGRANAIKLAGRVMTSLYRDTPFNLVSIEGGSKVNAIPREASFIIAVQDADAITDAIIAIEGALKKELVPDDSGFMISVRKAPRSSSEVCDGMLSFKTTSTIISALTLAPYGPNSFCPTQRELIESSTNPGVLTTDKEEIRLTFMSRSSEESRLTELVERIRALAKVTGAELSESAPHPGWSYIPDTPMQKRYLEAYRKCFPDMPSPSIGVTHGGLECGVIIERLGGCDAISIGPDLFGIHSPDERLDLDSCERLWTLMLELLK